MLLKREKKYPPAEGAGGGVPLLLFLMDYYYGFGKWDGGRDRGSLDRDGQTGLLGGGGVSERW